MTTTASPPDTHANLRRSLRATAERMLADARSPDRPHRLSRTVVRRDDLASVDGLGVTMVVDGRSVFAGANAFTEAVDEVQYDLGEGPCLAAVAAGRIVSSTRIATTERRWSRFTALTAGLGLRSVLSVPMVTGDEVVGSVNLYSRIPSGLVAVPPKVLRGLAADAEGSLSSPRLLALAESSARHLAHALDARAAVEHAVGLLMDRYLMSAGQARILLAQLARQNGTSEAAAALTLTDPEAARRPQVTETVDHDRSSAPEGKA
jgi:GAF domain-containing protein